jgi:putative DNA primase/helicase
VEALSQEASGILAWLVRGCLKWNEGGLAPPAYVKEATKHYKESEDEFGQFIAECCIVREHTRARAGALREKYEKWCAEAGARPCAPKRFAERLQKHFHKTRDRIGVLYEGIGLVDPDNNHTT